MKYVSVDGNRVKSKRNRIVPVPKFIRDELVVGNPHDNVFLNSYRWNSAVGKAQQNGLNKNSTAPIYQGKRQFFFLICL